MDTNEITGARLVSKVPTKEYEEGWDKVFGRKTTPCQGHNEHSWVLGEEATEMKQDNGCCGGCC